jgi:beta-lactamase regulating signal transducer with metallopeptidase domain
MVVGVFRPVVLLPISTFLGLAPDQLEAVLIHELAHIRRYDNLVNLLQRMVETVFFFHPAVWWVSGCKRSEAVCACPRYT